MAGSTSCQEYIRLWFARVDDFVLYQGTSWRRARRQVTTDDIKAGLDGSGPSVSSYTQDTDGYTHVLAIDFDTETGYEASRVVGERMWSDGVPAYVERSRAGRAHLFVTIDQRITAALVDGSSDPSSKLLDSTHSIRVLSYGRLATALQRRAVWARRFAPR